MRVNVKVHARNEQATRGLALVHRGSPASDKAEPGACATLPEALYTATACATASPMLTLFTKRRGGLTWAMIRLAACAWVRTPLGPDTPATARLASSLV